VIADAVLALHYRSVVLGLGPTVREPDPPPTAPPVRAELRARHDTRRIEKAYVGWIHRYILVHATRHPALSGESLRWRCLAIIMGSLELGLRAGAQRGEPRSMRMPGARR
jgi:hypothetical protein